MTEERDHRGPVRRDPNGDTVEGLAKKRPLLQQRDVLLGPVVPADAPSQRPQPHALTPGEHDAPQLAHGGASHLYLKALLRITNWLAVHLKPRFIPILPADTSTWLSRTRPQASISCASSLDAPRDRRNNLHSRALTCSATGTIVFPAWGVSTPHGACLAPWRPRSALVFHFDRSRPMSPPACSMCSKPIGALTRGVEQRRGTAFQPILLISPELNSRHER